MCRSRVIPGIHKRTITTARLDEPISLEFAIRPRHRIWRDPEIAREAAHGGKAGSRKQGSVANLRDQLAAQLFVRGRWRQGIECEAHCRSDPTRA